MTRFWLYCDDFARAGLGGWSCCSSCHEDKGMGYDMIEDEPPNRRGPFREPRIVADICCATSRDIERDMVKPDSITAKFHPDRAAAFDPKKARSLWAKVARLARASRRAGEGSAT